MGQGDGARAPHVAAAVPLGPCLGLVAVAALAGAMVPMAPDGRVGTYRDAAVVAAAAAGVLAVLACTFPKLTWRPPPRVGRLAVVGACLFLAGHTGYRWVDPTDATAGWAKAVVVLAALVVAAGVGLSRQPPAPVAAGLVAALALGLTGEAVFSTAVPPPYREGAATWVRLAAVAGFGLTASLLIHRAAVRSRPLFALQVVLLFAAGAVLRGAAVVAEPDPGIDVYYAQQQGADHLVAGRNPYGAAYDDEGAPFYPPLPLLLGAGARLAGLDVRFANVACDLVAALALLAAGRDRLLGGLLAGAYLHFPRVPLLTALGWYEPMLAALLGAGLLLTARGWRAGHFLLGLGVTGKQYGAVLLPPLLKSFRGGRRALLLGVALAAAAAVLPFALWGPRTFFDRVVFYHARLPVRYDGITVQAAAGNVFGVVVPKPFLLGAAALLIGWVTWRAPADGTSPAPWMAAALLAFCLCHSQAFFNYFYLFQYLMLLGAAGWLGRGARGGGAHE